MSGPSDTGDPRLSERPARQGDEHPSPEAELERVREERDRALASRDALMREMLPASGDKARARPRRRRYIGALLVATLLLVAATVVTLQRMAARLAAAGRQRPAHSSKPRAHAAARADDQRAEPRLQRRGRVSRIPLPNLEHLGRIALQPDGRLLAAAGGRGRVLVYDLQSGRALKVLDAHRGEVRDVVFTSDGKRLLSAGQDGAIHIWDAHSGRKLSTLRPRGTPIRDIAVAGSSVAVAAEQPEVELYAMASEKRPAAPKKLRGHHGWVRAVALSADGRRLVSAGHDRVVRLWNTDRAVVERELTGNRLWVNAVALSPDGALVAAAGFDKRIRLWRVADGSELHVLRGHVRRCVQLAFGPHSRLLASASLDRTAVLWDAKRGTPVARLRGHRYQVSAAVFEREGRFIATSSGDGSVRLWPLPVVQAAVMRPLPPPGPGEITLRGNTSGERTRIKLLGAHGEVLAKGRRQLARALRSGPDDRIKLPDPALVRLLYKVSEHFGRRREVEVISGYRSPEFNKLRTMQSRQVARKSRHIAGQAIDFRIHGITITSLHAYVKKLRAGGLGFYADSQFIHMDVGPVRYWTGN